LTDFKLEREMINISEMNLNDFRQLIDDIIATSERRIKQLQSNEGKKLYSEDYIAGFVNATIEQINFITNRIDYYVKMNKERSKRLLRLLKEWLKWF